MNKVLRIVLIFFSVATLEAKCATAIEMPPNAALQYWQAFSELSYLTDADVNLIKGAPDVPASEYRSSLVSHLRYSLLALHRGTFAEQCDWGSAPDGPETFQPHIQKAHNLNLAVCVVIREKFEEGKFEEGVQIARDALTMARNLSHHGTILSRYQEDTSINFIVYTLASEIRHMPKIWLQQLQKVLEQLPAQVPLSTVIPQEQDTIAWFVKTSNASDTERMHTAAILSAKNGDGYKPYYELLSDPVKFKSAMVEFGKIFVDFKKCATLPYTDFIDHSKATEAKLASSNLFAKDIFSQIVYARNYDERTACKLLMLRAGIELTLRGEKDASRTRDTYGTGTYIYSALEQDFELTSALLDWDGKHVKLSFHRPRTVLDKTKATRDDPDQF